MSAISKTDNSTLCMYAIFTEMCGTIYMYSAIVELLIMTQGGNQHCSLAGQPRVIQYFMMSSSHCLPLRLHLPNASIYFWSGWIALTIYVSLLKYITPSFSPLLPLSPIRVAASLIDAEPNGSWKRPFSPCCPHCCSDKTIKLLVKR